MLNSRMTGSGSYVNLLKLAWENSWNHINLILAVFSRMKPIWSGARSPAQLLSSTELPWQGKASRQALLVRVETCLLWLVFLPSPSFLTSSSAASTQSISRRSRWKFVQNSQILVLEEYFCTTWKLKWKVCLYYAICASTSWAELIDAQIA